HRAWDDGNLQQVRRLLDIHQPQAGDIDRRGFEWFYLNAASAGEQVRMKQFPAAGEIVLSPDSRFLLWTSNGTFRLQDLQEDRVLGQWTEKLAWVRTSVRLIDADRDGSRVVMTGPTGLRLWERASGKLTLVTTQSCE